jgi:hypothetical protein
MKIDTADWVKELCSEELGGLQVRLDKIASKETTVAVLVSNTTEVANLSKNEI